MEAPDLGSRVDDSRTPHDDRVTAYGRQLIDVHDRLRAELRRLLDAFDDPRPDGARPPRDLRVHCLAFCSALTRHHDDEQGAVFPALARRFPELRPVLDGMRGDHEAVSAMLRRIEELLDGVGPDPDPTEARRVRGELGGLAALLESHFSWEERRLAEILDVPVLPFRGVGRPA